MMRDETILAVDDGQPHSVVASPNGCAPNRDQIRHRIEKFGLSRAAWQGHSSSFRAYTK